MSSPAASETIHLPGEVRGRLFLTGANAEVADLLNVLGFTDYLVK